LAGSQKGLVSPGLSGLGKGFWYSVVIFLPRHSFLIPFVVSLSNHPLSWSFDKLRTNGLGFVK